MNIEAIKLNDIVSDETDIYASIMIISNRARQIIDKRFLEQINLEDLEDSEEFVIFNPKLEVLDETMQGFWEGCLSVPGLRGYVERPRKLRICYLDEKAEEREIFVEDFLATVFQHELDHLFGFLYVDRLSSIKNLIFENEISDIPQEKVLD